MTLPDTKKVDLENVGSSLSNKRGIYFWFDIKSESIVYIGIAVGTGGLKKRIIQQHLNPKYLEYREAKHTSKDEFQLKYAITRISKQTRCIKKGIDKSAFRKSVGRMLLLKPGEETLNYIKSNLRLEIFESEDIELIKKMERNLIMKINPTFNSAHKSA